MPQLDPASFPSQLFWLVVCFGTMLLVLSVFVLPRFIRSDINRLTIQHSGAVESDFP